MIAGLPPIISVDEDVNPLPLTVTKVPGAPDEGIKDVMVNANAVACMLFAEDVGLAPDADMA
ncbi:hypothetical protein A0256_15985 [Mucilaginibacter sp. PAMC 26640]|nr:hypothetical protein A0256_15985 [Mucilaginibacter sp. PAMC 26640]